MKNFISFCVLLYSLFTCSYAFAYPVKAEMLAESSAVSLARPFYVAVKFNIADGWHTYWKNAGEVGEPTDVTLTLPKGFRVGEIEWTVPTSFQTEGFNEMGYKGEVYHFIRIFPPEDSSLLSDVGKSIKIKANVSYMACKNECLPKQELLEKEFLISDYASNDIAFHQALAKVPQKYKEQLTFADNKEEFLVKIPFELKKDARFFPYGNEVDLGVKSYGQDDTLHLKKRTDKNAKVSEVGKNVLQLSGVLQNGNDLYEIVAKKDVSASSDGIYYFSYILLLAFVGGLLLNFMPCVFPVLSLKLFGLARAKNNTIKAEAFAYTAGVVCSFAVVAAAVVSLKNMGKAIGWGFQMQEPVFVLFLICLMMILGLMFLGLVHINPFFNALAQEKKGAFLSGVLAVLLATPCVAPFMGTAMAFAFLASNAEAMAVFVVMGLGMAFPFLLLSLKRGWIKYMPKSGLWLKRIQEILAIPLLVTAVWLVSVLERQTGEQGFLIALFLQVLIIIVALARKKILWLLPLIAFIFLSFFIKEAPKEVDLSSKKLEWQVYSDDKLQEALDRGEPVFIAASAVWCLTCMVNEKIALDTEEIAKLFKEKKILPLYADFSSKNESVAKMLNKYGRNGVPLYVLYKTGKKPEPVILPRILTKQVLFDYINGE